MTSVRRVIVIPIVAFLRCLFLVQYINVFPCNFHSFFENYSPTDWCKPYIPPHYFTSLIVKPVLRVFPILEIRFVHERKVVPSVVFFTSRSSKSTKESLFVTLNGRDAAILFWIAFPRFQKGGDPGILCADSIFKFFFFPRVHS